LEVEGKMNNKNKSIRTRTVIIHIGNPKTGSTSIQETLFHPKNRELLEKNGYLYPKSLYSNHSLQIVSAFCSNPSHFKGNIILGRTKKDIDVFNDETINHLKYELSQKQYENLIISGETISSLKSSEIKRFKHFLLEQVEKKHSRSIPVQFKIIMYIRHPCNFVGSRTQQLIRGGNTLKKAFNGVSEQTEFYNKNKLENFLEVFSRESIFVYQFEEAIQHKYSIAGHFLSQLGFSEEELREFKFIHANQRISMKATEIISYINEKKPLIRDNKLNKGRTSGDTAPLFELKGSKFDLTENQKRELFSKALPDMLWLKENFDIDFTQYKESEGTAHQPPVIYTKDDCQFFRQVFKKLSPSLRTYVISFFEEQLKPSRFDQIHQNTFVSRLKKADNKRKKKENKKKKYTILSLIIDYGLIILSGLFDKAYYFSNYPDIKAAGKNPIIHYIRHGALELRNPSEEFNTGYYLNLYKDVLTSGMNPLVHYFRFGRREGRTPKKVVFFND